MKKRVSRKSRRSVVAALVFAMMATLCFNGVFTVTARAEETTEKTISGLGTGTIANPTEGNGGWSRVYFGSKDTPILFNVLQNGETNFTSSGNPTLLLDCADILQYKKFDEDGEANSGAQKANEWKSSDIKKWLNGDLDEDSAGNFKFDRFTPAEISAIAASEKNSKVSKYDGYGYSDSLDWAPLEGEQIFLLDVVEATNKKYGFEDKDPSSTTSPSTTREKKLNGSAAWWWLRSPYRYYGGAVGFVNVAGDLGFGSVDHSSLGVSPALNVNLSSVIFSSLISGTAGQSGAEYKLTIKDSDLTIENTGEARDGSTITVSYNIKGANASNANQVSIVVTDSPWSAEAGWSSTAQPLQYSILNSGTSLSSTGSGSFTLDSSITGKWGKDFYVYLLAEEVNGEYETDYASAPVKINEPAGYYDSYVPTGSAGEDLDSKKVTFAGYEWYIIAGDSATDGTVTLFAVECIGDAKQFNADTSKKNYYSKSDIKEAVDAMTREGGVLADVAGAISTVTVQIKGYDGADGYDTAENVKCYLIDTETAQSLPEAVRKCNKAANGADEEWKIWWLCSPVRRTNSAACVDGDNGNVYDGGYVVNYTFGVRPALKLNLSSVIFSSESKSFSLKPPGYSVTITPGRNMTKTTDSGAASQTDLSGEMTDVVYTANDGYYFPTNYRFDPVNGISVTRNSYTQITVSGTPTADAAITLTAPTAKSKETRPDAAFTANGTDTGTLSGVADGMKYKVGNGVWTDITGSGDISLTGLSDCTIQVVKKGNGTTTVDSDVQEIKVTKAEPPTDPVAADCTIPANNDGRLTGVTSEMEYRKSDAAGWTAGTGDDITGLAPGTYYVRIKPNGTVLASGNQELTVKKYISATVTFRVENGAWNDGEGAAATADRTVTLEGHEGDTLKLRDDQIPGAGKRPGDKFMEGSWVVEPDTKTEISQDTTYTYAYAVRTFKVTVVNGTTGDSPAQEGAAVSIRADATSGDDLFLMWTTDNEGVYLEDSYAAETSFEMPAEDVTVTAMYAPPITVSFDTKGGTPADIESQTIPRGGRVKGPGTKITKDHFTHCGWYAGNDPEDTVDLISPFNESVTLKASWMGMVVVESHDVTNSGSTGDPGTIWFDDRAKTESPTGEVVLEGTDLRLRADANDGFRFIGWARETGSSANPYEIVETNEAYSFTVGSNAEQFGYISIPDFGDALNVHALFERVATIRFVNDDGTELQSGPVAYGSMPVYKGETPAKNAEGQCVYIFSGWTPGIAEVTGDATYKAAYDREVKVTFKVSNGSWDDDGKKDDIIVTLKGPADGTLKLREDQIPSAGSRPKDGTYKAGDWEPKPDTTTGITQDTVYTYKYAKKGTAEVTKAPGARNLTYNEQAQDLVTAGEASGGELRYALGKDLETPPPADDYSPEIPAGTDAGTYYVWYRVFADDDHLDSAESRFAVTISPGTPSGGASGHDDGLTYTGEEQELVLPGTVQGGSMLYALGDDASNIPGDSSFRPEIPKGTDAGTYYVWYKITGDANHNDVDPSCLTAVIKKARITPAASITGWTYGQAPSSPELAAGSNPGNGAVTYEYSPEKDTGYTQQVPVLAGPYFVRARVAETKNYEGGLSEGLGFAIARAPITITADDKSGYFGEDLKALTYTVDGGYVAGDELGVTVSSEVKKGSDAGTYPITVGWKGNRNYDAQLTGGTYTVRKIPTTASASGYTGAYDGKAHGITVDVAAATAGGAGTETITDAEVYYALTELTDENYKEAGSRIPVTLTDTGTAEIYYYAVKKNYEPAAGKGTVAISKAALGTASFGKSSRPAARSGLTYNGKGQKLLTAPAKLPDGCAKMQYRMAGASSWSGSIPAAVKAGTYTVEYRYAGDGNHKNSEAFRTKASIGRAEITITAEDKTGPRGASIKKLTWKVTGAYVSGDSLGIKASTTAKKTSRPGKYRISVSWNKNPDYTAVLKNGTYTITDRVTGPEKERAAVRMNSGFRAWWEGSGLMVSWGKAEEAGRYDILAAYCGKDAPRPVRAVSAKSGPVIKITNLDGKRIDRTKNIKVRVIAYRKVDGRYTRMGATLIAHVAGGRGRTSGYTNAGKVTVRKDSLTLRTGKTAAVRAKTVPEVRGKKLLGENHAARYRYASDDRTVATVDENGTVTAVTKGTCHIYVYAQNGTSGKITVTVK